jgi:hypothetical protein
MPVHAEQAVNLLGKGGNATFAATWVDGDEPTGAAVDLLGDTHGRVQHAEYRDATPARGARLSGAARRPVEQAEAEDGGAGGVRTSSRPCYARPRRALGYRNAVVAIALPLIGRSSS